MGTDEEGTLAALRGIWSERLIPAVAAHRGRIVKMLGDGALIEFASAVDADAPSPFRTRWPVTTAKGRTGSQSSSESREPRRYRRRWRRHLRRCVNVAARLEGQAPKSGISLSNVVHAQIKGKVDVAFSDAGEVLLKNIDTPVRVWRWGGDDSTPQAPKRVRAASSGIPSIAVLPFANMSGDPEQDFFADGLVEDIRYRGASRRRLLAN
jgi:adenylate cyclase